MEITGYRLSIAYVLHACSCFSSTGGFIIVYLRTSLYCTSTWTMNLDVLLGKLGPEHGCSSFDFFCSPPIFRSRMFLRGIRTADSSVKCPRLLHLTSALTPLLLLGNVITTNPLPQTPTAAAAHQVQGESAIWKRASPQMITHRTYIHTHTRTHTCWCMIDCPPWPGSSHRFERGWSPEEGGSDLVIGVLISCSARLFLCPSELHPAMQCHAQWCEPNRKPLQHSQLRLGLNRVPKMLHGTVRSV